MSEHPTTERRATPAQQARKGRCGHVNQDGEPCVCTRWLGHKGPHRGPSPGEFYQGERFEWPNQEQSS